MLDKILGKIKLEYDIKKAIENDEFTIYYQPQVTIDNKVTGAEALIRWNHPTKGFISPAQFIPLAEETGLITQLDQWVFKKVLQDIHNFGKDSKLYEDISNISINISSQSFESNSFVEDIMVIMKTFEGLAIPICLELTERIIVKDIQKVTEKMHCLKELGFMLSMDDFGTGYSSLAYLKHMPFDVLKIDMVFVRNLHLSKKDSAVASSILALSDTLELKCVAEGVEYDEEVQFLHQKGCQCFQGFYFYKPLPAETFFNTLF